MYTGGANGLLPRRFGCNQVDGVAATPLRGRRPAVLRRGLPTELDRASDGKHQSACDGHGALREGRGTRHTAVWAAGLGAKLVEIGQNIGLHAPTRSTSALSTVDQIKRRVVGGVGLREMREIGLKTMLKLPYRDSLALAAVRSIVRV